MEQARFSRPFIRKDFPTIWPTDGSSHYALRYSHVRPGNGEANKGKIPRYADSRCSGNRGVSMHSEGKIRSWPRYSWKLALGACRNAGTKAEKKRKKEKERKKSGKKIDGGRGGKLAKLSNDPRYDDYLDSLVIGNNGRRSNEGPTDKKVIDTDTEYYEFKNPWILYRSLSYRGINLRIYLDDLFPIFSFRQQVYESAKSHRSLAIFLFFPFLSFLPSRNKLSRYSIAEHEVAALSSCGMSGSMEVGYRCAVKYILLT